MARRFDYFFRETATGLRRNGWVAFGAMSTSFVALFLFGLALLGRREVDLIIGASEGKIDVVVYLNQGISSADESAIQQKLQGMPQVSGVTYCSSECAYQRAKQIFQSEPALLEGVTPTSLPASFRVTLHDPHTFPVIAAQLQGMPGIVQPNGIRDNAAFLNTLFTITGWLRNGVLIIAGLMLISAAFLIANTVRLGLFARRREIGIMKLVGATNWFIRVPFLIEGVVEGLIGAVLALLMLLALKTVFINPLYGTIRFFPWIQTGDLIGLIPWILLAGVGVAVVASFAGMRRFLEV